jgi:hypothetical protein
MSHVLTNSTKGHFSNWGKYEPETLPHPMTATLMRLAAPCASAASGAAPVADKPASAIPALAVAL